MNEQDKKETKVMKPVAVTMTIIIKRCDAAAYVAYIQAEPQVWEFGHTAEEALGKLVLTNRYQLNLSVKMEDADHAR